MIKLKKYQGNPILKPELDWEKDGIFNPAVIQNKNGEFVMIYRAVKDNDSCLGIAYSKNGFIFEKKKKPFLNEIEPIEDPRIIYLKEEDIYIVAFTDLAPWGPEIGFIKMKNFQRISSLITLETHSEDKDAVLFNKKINKKYYLIHRPHRWTLEWLSCRDSSRIIKKEKIKMPKKLPMKPSIWMASTKDKNFVKWGNDRLLLEPKYDWEWRKVGIGPPPVLTSEGWLIIYHGVDKKFKYRAGAGILDKKKPWKLKYRLPYPILEPEKNQRIIFPTAIVEKNNNYLIYYGVEDKEIELAEIPKDEIIEEIKKYPVK